jgi:hypothetical protein
MSKSSSKLAEGIELWKKGQTDESGKVFEAIIREGSQDETAWFWYSYTRETNQEKISALNRCLILFPNNDTLRKALAALREQERQASQRTQEDLKEVNKENHPPIKLVPVSVQEAPSHGKVKSSNLPWILVTLGLCLLLFSSIVYVRQYNSLQAQYRKLESNNQVISQDLAQLNTEYETLQSEKTILFNQYNSLIGQYDSLNGEYSTLQGRYSALNNDYSVLTEKYNSLSVDHANLTNTYNTTVDDFSAFKKTAIAPPYIYIHGREVELAFLTPSQETYTWSVPFDSLERDLKRGNYERNRILIDPTYPRLVLNNSAIGEKYEEIDYRRFVDPGLFSSFSSYFYERAPSEEAFIQEMWYIVAQLTAYSAEITDTPRYPLETLLAGGGDCEDHAILFASMILAAAPSSWTVDLVYMDSYNPTNPQTINHMIVYIDTGNHSYTVEATRKDFMEPYSEGVRGWYSEIEH